MKRGVIALILLILAGFAAGYQYFYVTSNTGMLVEMLREADQSVEENDLLTAKDTVERLDHRYNELEKSLHIFIHHKDTDAVSQHLAALRRYAETGNTADFLATSAVIKRALLSMYNTEVPCFQNVM
ncbi:MAG: DUF4363 family protein [Ruminococcus sp.]|nr:DUF4363 family protein [Ruminococcus sp.]